jgi:hypothetical protein
VACSGNGKPDLILGTTTCSSSVYGLPVTSSISDLVSLGDAGQPSGTTSQFLAANIDAASAIPISMAARPTRTGSNRRVQETTSGGYLQFDVKGDLFGLEYAGNAGIRYAHTDQRSTGYTAGVAAPWRAPMTTGCPRSTSRSIRTTT